MNDAFQLDATGQAALVSSGQITPTELVAQTIERINKVDPDINSIVIPRYEAAIAEAGTSAGPFAGVPYVIKDHTLVTDGDLHVQGVKGLKDGGLRGDHDSYFVQRMRRVGFVLVGKTNLPELALSHTTEPEAWGPTRNPWSRDHSVGGSSGGSAAAVAARLVPVAEGTDGGGSGRMPAAACGVYGLKPTRGRVSSGPLVNATDNVGGMGTEAIIARTVRDVAAILDIVQGHEPGEAFGVSTPARPFAEALRPAPKALRIGILDRDPAGVATINPESRDAVTRAADVLLSLSHRVSPGYPRRLAQGSWPEQFLPCFPLIVKRELDRLGELLGRPLGKDDMEPATWAMREMADNVTAEQFAAGIDSLRIYGRELESWWLDDGWDLLLTPTLPAPPSLLRAGAATVEAFIEDSNALTPETFTVPYNVSGQPAIAVPVTLSSAGLPIGVQLVAAWGREDLLLSVAAQLEQHLGWDAVPSRV